MSEPQDKMSESIRFKLAELVNHKLYVEDIPEEDVVMYDPLVPLAEILCAHLKFFMTTIIKRMAMQKKKYLLSSPLLNKRQDPKNPLCAMSTRVGYESTLFTAEDFLDMLRAFEHIIPPRPIYNLYIERLVRHKNMKLSLPNKEDEEENIK